ncbi:GerMN domain-containing protein [Micromonospora endolithica]|uniref:GerMN domain-containing protein n=1 Tax=Micromonospora endolithica TaxID=230091 RepID=A0A3A9ZHT4_9ACTN|nr:GerMN domain-containing protein [Micromonospora endolithica]RKN47843.1 hypothetical protein D7223_13995 [Micromonospora endolithica]TWJ21533.1 sporulation and spore germination protein [Micromonospora endolithica]
MTARTALSALAVVLVLAGCGVPTDARPRPVQAPASGPFPTPVTASSSVPAGREAEVLCLVREDHLVRVVRRVDRPPSLDAQVRDLLAGPTPAERDDGFTSALPGAVAVTGVRLVGTRAEVDVRGVGDENGRSDEILAFGQLVCTLTARTGVDAVSFREDGQPLDVPRADASLSRQPLTAADYATLIRPG